MNSYEANQIMSRVVLDVWERLGYDPDRLTPENSIRYDEATGVPVIPNITPQDDPWATMHFQDTRRELDSTEGEEGSAIYECMATLTVLIYVGAYESGLKPLNDTAQPLLEELSKVFEDDLQVTVSQRGPNTNNGIHLRGSVETHLKYYEQV